MIASGIYTCIFMFPLQSWGAFSQSHVVSSLQFSGLHENFFSFLFHEWQVVQGISVFFSSITITISCILRLYISCGKKIHSKYLYSKSPKKALKIWRSGAQAGIWTRVLRATAAYTRPNYTTWANKCAATIHIILAN